MYVFDILNYPIHKKIIVNLTIMCIREVYVGLCQL